MATNLEIVQAWIEDCYHRDRVGKERHGVRFLAGADLCGLSANWMPYVTKPLNLRNHDMRGVLLRGANLEGFDLTDADLSGADLRGAFLDCAILDGADFSGADLRGAVVSRDMPSVIKGWESADTRGIWYAHESKEG